MRTAALLTLALIWTAAQAEEAPPPANPSAPLPPRVAIKTNHGTIVVELFPEEAPETVANFLGLVEGTKAHRYKGALVKKPYYDGMIFHRVIKGFMLQGGCPNSNGSGNPGYQFKDEINADALGLDKMQVIQNKQWHPWLLIRDQQALSRMIVAPLCAKLGIRTNEELQKRLPEVQKIVDKMTIKECYENLGYKFDSDLKSRKPMRGTLAMANAGPNTNGSQFFINMEDNVYLTGKHTVFGRVVSGMDIAKKIESVAVDRSSKPVAPVVIESMRRVVERKAAEGEPTDEKKAEKTAPPAEAPPPAPEEPKKDG